MVLVFARVRGPLCPVQRFDEMMAARTATSFSNDPSTFLFSPDGLNPLNRDMSMNALQHCALRIPLLSNWAIGAPVPFRSTWTSQLP